MTGREIIDILEEFGELDWARWGNINNEEEQLRFPPVIVWRFKTPRTSLDNNIVKAVETFQGKINWIIFYSGKNWVLEPERVRLFIAEGNYKVDSQALADMAELEPEIGIAANKELPNLAKHLRKTLRS